MPKRVLIPLAIGGLIAYPLLASLAVSMVYVRTVYSRESARKQISLVVDMMGKSDELGRYLEDKAGSSRLWDEHYYNPGNVFLARFANVKYHDNGLYLAELNDEERALLQRFTWGNMLSILPAPVLNAVGFDIKKNEYLSMSTGDYMFWLRYGRGLGGQRTGSAIAQGLAIFGLAHFLVWGAIMALFFTTVDSFSRRFRIKGAYRRIFREGRPVLQNVISTPQFAPIALLNIFVVLDPYRAGSFTETPQFLIRALPQQLIMYALLMLITQQIAKVFTIARKDRSSPRGRQPGLALEPSQGS